MRDHPVALLLEKRKRPVSAQWLGAALLAGLVLSQLSEPMRFPALAVLLAVFPWLIAHRLAGLWTGLRNRGCLEELMASPTPSPQWVDGVAFETVLRLSSLAGWLTLVDGCWLAAGGFSFGWLPVVVLAQIGFGGMASYAAQLGSLRCGWSELAATALLVLAGTWHPFWALVCLMAVRRKAIAGLGPRQQSRPEQARVARDRILEFSANPIVFRERCSERQRSGLMGVAFWRHGLTTLVVTAIGLASYQALHSWFSLAGVLWTALLTFFLIQTLRAAFHTVGALVDERERGSLEALLQTTLSGRDWVLGWALVGFVPRALENLVASLLLVGVAELGSLSGERFLLCGLILMAFTLAASVAGVYASAASSFRHDACDRLGVELTSGLWLLGLFSLFVALWAPLGISLLSLGLAAAVVSRYFQKAVKMVVTEAHDETHPQLHRHLRKALAFEAPQGFKDRLRARWDEEESAELLSGNLHQKAGRDFKNRLLERLEEEGLVNES